MNECFYVRFSGEVWLKNEYVKRKQINLIIKNLRLPRNWIINKRERLIILNKNKDLIFYRLNKTFGISSFSLGFFTTKKEISEIKKISKKIVKNWNVKSFKVETTRADKNFNKNSMEISKLIGEYILSIRDDLRVDLENPEKTLFIEVRNDHIFVSDNVYHGLNGLPYGFSGTGLSLISGGIDSPVATFLAMKRGIKIIPIHFYIDDDSLKSVKKCLEILNEYGNLYPLELINHKIWLENTKEALKKINKERYLCIICKRKMLKQCIKLSETYNIKTIITGESVSQVASQTLDNMYCISRNIDLNIIRPLICFDKDEIISIAKKIGTFNYQTTKKCPFVPKNPITKCNLRAISKIEKTLNNSF